MKHGFVGTCNYSKRYVATYEAIPNNWHTPFCELGEVGKVIAGITYENSHACMYKYHVI